MELPDERNILALDLALHTSFCDILLCQAIADGEGCNGR